MIRATKHDLLWFDGRRRRTMRDKRLIHAPQSFSTSIPPFG